jgi:hypothetical protein
MKFLPTENITYKTRLNEVEVIRRLSEIIEPEKTFRFGVFSSGPTKPYEGRINGQTFNMKRIIWYRNSFLPRINGTIEKEYDGTAIKIKMRLHVFVTVFLFVWCGGIGFACISILTQTFGNSELNPVDFIPFGMLLFAYGLTMGGFKFESYKSKKDLQNIFEANIIEK